MNLRPPVEKNDDIELVITALSSEGQGIGRIDGYTVFVPYAIPGELVRAHVIKVTSGYAVAKLTEILKKSDERTENTCPVYPRCGGCTLRHLAYPAQLEAKTRQVTDALIRLGKFEAPEVLPCIGMENPECYRNKGSFPMGYDENFKVTPGFFAQRSHRIIPISACAIQSPDVMEVTNAVAEWANMYSVPPYDETTRKGVLRHAMARTSHEGVLALVVTSGKLPHGEALVELLRQKIPNLTGVVHNINFRDTNVILGDKFITLWGSDRLNTTIAGHTFGASMASFLQVNPQQTEVLYGKALEFLGLEGGERVADVYCGIGTITLMLAEHAGHVTGIECVPAAIADAKVNAKNNEKLMFLLQDVPAAEKTAQFVSVITLAFPDGRVIVARGECPGRIIAEPAGENGFGYDPLFVPDGYDRTFAQLTAEEKNQISHRAVALQELERQLKEMGY